MFYYAQINDNYEVVDIHSLEQTSTEENYIEITEEQYTNGDLVGMYYNRLSGAFEIMTDSMGTTDNVEVVETHMMLSTKLDNMDVEIDSKADIDHAHTEYASSDDLQVLADIIDTKADITHTHSEYSPSSHSHTEYVVQTLFDSVVESLESEIDSKADISHTHSEYAISTHLHEEYADVNHNHNSDYSLLSHTHDDYITTTDFNALETEVSGKAEVGHSHTGVYDTSGSAASALTSANAYTDSKIDALVGEGASATLDTIGEISVAIEDNQDAIDILNSAIANKANVTDLNAHASDTELHITDAERNIWNAKSDFSGNYNDLTNKPNIPSVDGLASEDYVDEKVGAITVESIGALPNTTVIPTVPTNVSAFANDAGYLTEHQSLDGLATETYVSTQIDAIDIPSALSDLSTDSTHRVVTDTEKATWNAKSDFSGSYNDLTDKPSVPSISGLATETYVDEAVSVKADSGHTHGDIYYTETEIDSLLSAKADSSHTHSISNVSGLQSALDSKSATTHNHDTSYDTLGAANSALTSAKEYADELVADEVTNRDSAIATAKSSAISTASSDATTKANNALASAKTYTDSAVATVKDDLLNGAGTAYDTLKELGDLIDDNVDAIEALETVASGKANASHTHTISDVTNLQIALDGKAAASHGTHVTYSSTAPVMDGTASVGSASTVARSDHKHPTDTSRASQTDLDSLETVVAGKANSSHTHTIANVTNLQSSLDAKQATITGGASTITTSNLTANRALVSNSSGKVAVSAVTSTELGYLDGVTSNVQTQLDGKAASSHTHTVSQISDLTATATELNYTDGVTSNIQTQLDEKASLSHTHSYAASSSVGGAATSANKLNTNAGSATQPVYFSNGVPVATTYALNKTVPSNAVFTDTVYTHPTYTARTGVPTANATLSHGGTFTVSQTVSDTTGHITALNTRTYTMPSETTLSTGSATATSTLSHSGTFTAITGISVSGHKITPTITTYTLPTDNNTDTKVTNTLATTTKAYVTGTTSATTNTGTQVFDTGVYLDTVAGKLTATTFNGTTFSGSGVATVSEVETYLGI